MQVDGKKVNRTWTVSSSPELIRRFVKIQITVKRAAYVSAWLHDQLPVTVRRVQIANTHYCDL